MRCPIADYFKGQDAADPGVNSERGARSIELEATSPPPRANIYAAITVPKPAPASVVPMAFVRGSSNSRGAMTVLRLRDGAAVYQWQARVLAHLVDHLQHALFEEWQRIIVFVNPTGVVHVING